MKIAIAVFGIPRGADVTFAPLLKNVVEPARQVGDVEMFGHFFDVARVDNVRSGEAGSLSRKNFEVFTDFNCSLEQPGACLDLYDLQSVCAYGDFYEDNFKSVKNLTHQLHSLKQVTLRMQAWQPDVVIFARPDLLYHDRIPERLIRSAGMHPERCYLPHWQWWGGYNDRFAVCGRDAYLHYGSRIDHMVEYCRRKNGKLHAENLLRSTLRFNGVKLRQLPVRASRVRIGDVVYPENFDSRRTIGPRKFLPEMAVSHVLTKFNL